MKPTKHKFLICNYLLLASIILENLFLFYFFNTGQLTQGKNAWGLFLSSVLFGVLLLYKFYNTTPVASSLNARRTSRISYVLLTVFFLTGLIWLGSLYSALLVKYPIDPAYSDILPNIQILCRRLLSGRYAYNIIQHTDYSMSVTYLPLHWMPFITAELLKTDYRWVGLAIWGIAATLLFIHSLSTANIYMRVVIPFLILGANYVLYLNNPDIITITVEIMISGYYMMLVSGLAGNSGFIQGLFISFCILSRYSLVLWLPLYALVLVLSHNQKQLYRSISIIVLMVTVFYVIPFLSKDWTIFYRGYKEYDNGIRYEWAHIQQYGVNQGKPIMLFSGTGFAYYIYTRFTGLAIDARIRILHEIHLVCSLLIVVLMAVWYWFNKERINYKIFLLGSFQIYISVFLFFIPVPYPYLMIVGNFVSIAIFCGQARYHLKHNTITT